MPGAALDRLSIGTGHGASESDEIGLVAVRRDDLWMESRVALGDGGGALGRITDPIERVGDDIPARLQVVCGRCGLWSRYDGRCKRRVGGGGWSWN